MGGVARTGGKNDGELGDANPAREEQKCLKTHLLHHFNGGTKEETRLAVPSVKAHYDKIWADLFRGGSRIIERRY